MAWELTGNSSTNPASNFLGTTDSRALVIKTNGLQRLRVAETGNLEIFDDAGKTRFEFSGQEGLFTITDGSGRAVMQFDSRTAELGLGTQGHAGRLELSDNAGKIRFEFSGQEGLFAITDGSGRAVMQFDSRTAELGLGTQGHAGRLELSDNAGKIRFEFSGQEGLFTITDGSGRAVMQFDSRTAELGLGTQGHAGRLELSDNAGKRKIELDGQSGDIRLHGADCAEYFDIAEAAEIAEPGTAMIVDRDGKLRESQQAYDKRVAGVISGAGDYKPGLILSNDQSQNKRLPLALTGKVYCKVDAGYAPINVGDLLTTSPTPGYAMKVSDPRQAFGAVLGKALRSLTEGRGLIPILIALQ